MQIILSILFEFILHCADFFFSSSKKKKFPTKFNKSQTIHGLSYTSILNKTVELSSYKNKVILLVNTASKCGFTTQYNDLQSLYEKYHKDGFEIIGFPCNQFKNQEPGSNHDIKQFCELKYKTTFPMSEKIDVKGINQHPIYKFLTQQETNPYFSGSIKWNFNKFLINKKGQVIARYGSMTKPLSQNIQNDIKTALAEESN